MPAHRTIIRGVLPIQMPTPKYHIYFFPTAPSLPTNLLMDSNFLPTRHTIKLKSCYSSEMLIYLHRMPIYMSKKAINRLKAVLAEQGKTNKWLAEQLDKNETTVSRWCTNEVQPSIDNLVAIASLLKIDVKDLINSTINQNILQ